MTLAEMTAQFTGLMNRTDLKNNTALASTFITQAILRIQRELRCPMQEATILYTIPTTYDPVVGLAIPSDFLELIGLFVGANQEYQLQRGEFSTVKSLAVNATSTPEAISPIIPAGGALKFARLGGNWIIGPAPAAGRRGDDPVLRLVPGAREPHGHQHALHRRLGRCGVRRALSRR